MEVTVNGKSVYYSTGGAEWKEGLPLIVFLHGAGLTHAAWALQSRAFAHHGWNVAVPDLPGHGYSEDDSGIATMEDYGAWLAAYCEALGVARAVVAGHSLGAALAVTYAANYPDRVTALVLMGVGPELPVNPGLLRDTKEDPPRAMEFIIAYGHARSASLGRSPTPGTWLLGSDHALLKAGSGEVLHRDFLAAHQWDGKALLADVRSPALVLTGEFDRMTPPSQGRRLAEALPAGTFAEIPAGGHMLMVESPREVLIKMRAFLSTLD